MSQAEESEFKNWTEETTEEWLKNFNLYRAEFPGDNGITRYLEAKHKELQEEVSRRREALKGMPDAQIANLIMTARDEAHDGS